MSVAWPGHFIPNSATFFPLSALCTWAGAKTLEVFRFVMFSMFEHEVIMIFLLGICTSSVIKGFWLERQTI